MTLTAARTTRPGSAEELARALRDADEAGLAVVPRGAGAQQYLGNPPTRGDLVLETSALAGIVEYTPADLTVTVRAGTPLAALQRELARAGQRLPLDPPHATTATVGGLIATNASGPRRQRHGTLRDLVIGTRVALVDGTIARAGGKVVKNVAGYDLNKLFIGSLGTLGVIVEATFKVVPIPEREEALTATFASLGEAFEAAFAVARAPLRASALEVRDVGGGASLVVLAEGGRLAVGRVLDDAGRSARACGAHAVERSEESDTLLAASGALVEQLTSGAVLRASLPLAAQPTFALEVERLARDSGATVAIAAHAGAGVVRARFLGEPEAVGRATLGAAAAASSLQGDAWVERAADDLRSVIGDVWCGEPRGFFLSRRLKEEFDPKSTLNPGRFVGGI